MKASVWVIAACLSAQMFAPREAIAQGKAGAATKAGASKADPKAGAKPDPKAGAKPDPKAGAKPDPKGEPTPADKAKEFVKSGDKAAASGEWEDAYADYTIAWSMYQGWETAIGAGKAANKTGHHAEAVERLSFYLREVPAKSTTAKGRIEAEAMLEDSKSKTGMLTIVAPEGGDVFLDRNPLGKTPLAAAIRVDPGKHEIEIRRGAAGETKSTEVTAGGTVEVKFDPPKVAGPPKVIVKEDNYRWRTPTLITGSGLAVAGLALGGVTLGLTFDKASAKNGAAQDPNGLATATQAANDEALFKNVMVWSFVGAGVALAATAVVFFVIKPPAKKPATEAPPADSPPHARGFTVRGAVGVGPAGPSLLLKGEF